LLDLLKLIEIVVLVVRDEIGVFTDRRGKLGALAFGVVLGIEHDHRRQPGDGLRFGQHPTRVIVTVLVLRCIVADALQAAGAIVGVGNRPDHALLVVASEKGVRKGDITHFPYPLCQYQ
jgi:hypothetical protein